MSAIRPDACVGSRPSAEVRNVRSRAGTPRSALRPYAKVANRPLADVALGSVIRSALTLRADIRLSFSSEAHGVRTHRNHDYNCRDRGRDLQLCPAPLDSGWRHILKRNKVLGPIGFCVLCILPIRIVFRFNHRSYSPSPRSVATSGRRRCAAVRLRPIADLTPVDPA